MRSGRRFCKVATLRFLRRAQIIYKSPGPVRKYVTCHPNILFSFFQMGGAQRSSSSSPTTGLGGVNIEKAENSFNELSRQLTQGTVVDDDIDDREHGDDGTRVPTSIGNRTTKDLEKGAVDLEQAFDLREYLSSSNDANERAGIKHKHVGVVWEDFHVDVLGGSDFKVGVMASQGYGC